MKVGCEQAVLPWRLLLPQPIFSRRTGGSPQRVACLSRVCEQLEGVCSGGNQVAGHVLRRYSAWLLAATLGSSHLQATVWRGRST